MTRKLNEENERIKRRYLTYLREAKRRDHATVDKAAEAILSFEKSTGFKSFKRFHIEQATSFKAKLEQAKHSRTDKPLSRATVDNTLRTVKAFILWLAGQPGYKSRISYSDADYFNLNAKDARIAHTHRAKGYPTIEQCQHAFSRMPSATDIEKRNKALFAFLMITGARDGAIASMRLSAVDLMENCVYQDARHVNTKGAKTFTTWFMPTGAAYLDCFTEWVRYLREDLLFGNDDALFPKPHIAPVDGAFAVTGLSRDTYSNAGPLRDVIKVDAPNSDLFDVLGYVMFTNAPKTREYRADTVKGDKLMTVQGDLKDLLISILDAYEQNGEGELATQKLGQFLAAKYGSVGEAKVRLGGLPTIKEAFRRMQAQLYAS